jgi:LuxR family maltose regulon positive regulatory protein
MYLSVDHIVSAIMRTAPESEDVAGALNDLAKVEQTQGDITAAERDCREDVRGFIQAFTGSNRYILDYLVEEVLRRQPESVQAFLMRTSILDRLCGPLCDAVTGRTDSQRTLTMLEQSKQSGVVPK